MHTKRDVHRLAIILIKYIPAIALKEAMQEIVDMASCMANNKFLGDVVKEVRSRLDGKEKET